MKTSLVIRYLYSTIWIGSYACVASSFFFLSVICLSILSFHLQTIVND
jgi:hypothetical protein